jgi:hypothetical protein
MKNDWEAPSFVRGAPMRRGSAEFLLLELCGSSCKRSRGVSEKPKVCATGVFYMKGR